MCLAAAVQFDDLSCFMPTKKGNVSSGKTVELDTSLLDTGSKAATEQNEDADAGEGEELPPSAATGVVEATGTECQTGTEPGQHVDRLQGTQLVGVEAPDGGGDTAEN